MVFARVEAIMLDGVFNLTYFATGLFTLKVVRLIARGDDERFPYSYAFFEPLVNGAISSCVLVAFAGIFVIRGTALEWLVPFVDPIVVLAVVLISIGVPVRMAWQALMELLNRAAPAEIVEQVTEIVEACTTELPVRKSFVRVVQPGRTRLVTAHVVLPEEFGPVKLDELDAVRQRTLERLQAAHPGTILDIVFTSDPTWGAPTGATGQEPSAPGS